MSESMRSFKMDFSDVRTKRKLIHIDKPFRFTFFGYNRPEMYIYDY